MPSHEFDADAGQRAAILAAVFELGIFRVYECGSEPDRPLREFRSAAEVPDEPAWWPLELHTIGAGPVPRRRRITLAPDAVVAGTYVWSLEGDDLVQLQFGRAGEPSRIGHRSPAVRRAYGRLHRAILEIVT